MVKKSKKSKSKRVPLKKKYKIIRKVKEHHKKKAKEAKKLIGKKKAPAEKDPGIPNAWPFKEEELQKLEVRRARALEAIEIKKQAKKERVEKRKLGLPVQDEDALADMAKAAASRTSQFENQRKTVKDNANGREGSQRSFYKELLKVIEASDVIIEVLDARDPLGSRCKDVERLVVKSGPGKHLILLLNKIDLIPKEVAEKWLKYLREELPTVAFKCSTQQQRSNLGHTRKSKSQTVTATTSECLGAETLLQLLKNYSRNNKLKTAITVGVIGLPNVGKSSLINSMKRTRAVNVGAVAGVTKVLQEVQLDKHVKLLDCPGVVMAKASENEEAAVLRNSKRIENVEDPVGPVREILRMCPQEKMMSIYKIPSFESTEGFLQHLAQVRGKLKKGGALDLITTAKLVLKDWNEGKIPHFSLPPARHHDEHANAAILSHFSQEFNIDDIYQRESSTLIASLPSLVESIHVELPANLPVSMEIPELKVDEEEENDDGDSDKEETNGGSDDDDAADMDTVETIASNVKGLASTQNEKLYNVEGIFNPRLAKAQKKRRKKALKQNVDKEENSGSDYDFDVDYTENGDAEVEPMMGIQ